ncbi:MAG: EAL domain-containing protein [Thainema sp.]
MTPFTWMEFVLNTVTDAVVMLDVEGAIQWCNLGFARLVHREQGQLLQQPFVPLFPLQALDGANQMEKHPIELALVEKTSGTGQYIYWDGNSPQPLHLSWDFYTSENSSTLEKALEHKQDGSTSLVLVCQSRMNARTNNTQQTEASTQSYPILPSDQTEAHILEALGAYDGLWDWHLDSQKIAFSAYWRTMLGEQHDPVWVAVEDWLDHVHIDDRAALKAALEQHLHGQIPYFRCQYRILAEGSYRWMLSRGLAFRDGDGTVHRVVGLQTDITEQKELQERLVHDALHDDLTSLPNRLWFRDRITNLANQAKSNPQPFAVLIFDVDRFKVVNDSLGPVIADQLIIKIAQRTIETVQPGTVVARLGGDEFAVLLDNLMSEQEATELAQQLQTQLSQPCLLEGHEVIVTISIGIVFSDRTYEQPDDLLRNADIAMNRAKQLGRSRYEVFETSMHRRAMTLLRLENDLRRAIEREEFEVYYQPFIALATERATGFEALIRWHHPEQGFVSPGDFIPIAEDTGLIVPIGYWVLRQACQQMHQWLMQHPVLDPRFKVVISVNLSSRQFTQPDLVEQIVTILKETQLEARYLKLEITESVIMSNPETTAKMLNRLKEEGIQVSIDDFGTGYSSLSYLYRLPIDTLKIDRSFVNSIDVDGEKLELVRTIVSLAWNLGMDVIAEGVETAMQLAQLKALRCESAQGYYFSKPLKAEAAGLFWQEHR